MGRRVGRREWEERVGRREWEGESGKERVGRREWEGDRIGEGSQSLQYPFKCWSLYPDVTFGCDEFSGIQVDHFWRSVS